MADGNFGDVSNANAVPVAQILRTRADFPDRSMTYELRLTGADWSGIAALCAACKAVGLRLVSLRCSGSSYAFCVLGDDGSVDLDCFSKELPASLEITSWTTLILY